MPKDLQIAKNKILRKSRAYCAHHRHLDTLATTIHQRLLYNSEKLTLLFPHRVDEFVEGTSVNFNGF